MSDTTGRSSQWTPGTGDHSERQLHALIASMVIWRGSRDRSSELVPTSHSERH
jgi:hypothetical protein